MFCGAGKDTPSLLQLESLLGYCQRCFTGGVLLNKRFEKRVMSETGNLFTSVLGTFLGGKIGQR